MTIWRAPGASVARQGLQRSDGRRYLVPQTGHPTVTLGTDGAMAIILQRGGDAADAAYVEAVLSASTVADFHLEVAGTLQEGLALLAGQRFDVVLSDLTLPDGDGLGTFTALRDRVPGVPVVVITGATDAAVVAACATRMLGALRPTDVLARIGPTEFAAAVEGLVRPANAERAAHRILGSLAGEIPGEAGAPVRVVAGVGLTWGHGGDDPNKLLLAAEQALNELRRSAGQGVHWSEYHP